jgi:DNA-binding HxlR family transcriptional regulator
MKKDAAHRPGLCPKFHFAVELVGRRWNGAILFLLQDGPSRFGELREAIPGITDPMLSGRLRELTAEGIVSRAVLPGAPVRVEYALTDKGRALSRVMKAIGDWSHAWPAGTEKTAGGRARRPPAAKSRAKQG